MSSTRQVNGQKDSTIAQYQAQITALAKQLGHDIVPDGYKWLDDFDKVLAIINKSESLHTRKNKLNTVCMVIRMYDGPDKLRQKYYDELIKNAESIKSSYLTNEKNDKQQANWVERKQLDDLLTSLKNKVPAKIEDHMDYNNWQRHFMLYFHIKYPLRNELADTKIYLDTDKVNINDPDTNYIILDKSNGTATLILNAYKTNKTYGQKIIQLDNDTAKLIGDNYNELIKLNNHWLINNNGTKLTRNAYGKRFINLFSSLDKNVGTSLMRHIIVSEMFKPKPGEMEARTQLANLMGHSVMEQQTVYSKY